MAQHDYNLANQSGADFRADLNNALSAIVTVNSGATAPSTTFSHQLWVDTSSNVLKIRNAANDAWVTTGVSITADNTFVGNLTGNAATATALATARTINGASFDGTANISFNTDSVSEGSSNLYFTNARVESYLDAGTATPTFASAVINTSITGSAILDDNSFGTASATTVSTSESIKAYVDSQIGSVDTLAEILLNGNTTGGTDIAFGDNDKAIFGTGSDLEIYHDGSNSYIAESGTGSLYIQGQGNIYLQDDTGAETYARFQRNNAVKLYFDNDLKFATTSTGIDVTGEVESDTAHFGTGTGTGTIIADEVVVSGTGSTGITIHSPDANNATLVFGSTTDNDYAYIQGYYNSGSPFIRTSISGSEVTKVTSSGIDVTGTVTSDGLTVQTSQGDIAIANSASSLNFARAGTNYIRATDAAGHFKFITGANDFATQRLNIAANGDISFYDDTGTTQGLFWDSSAEKLGIGTTAPAEKLSIQDGDIIVQNDTKVTFGYRGTSASSALAFRDRFVGVDRVTISAAGNVGIGTNSPDALLHLSANTGATLRLESTDTAVAANEVMGAIEWEGNDATTGSTGIAGKIDVITEDATPEYSMRFFTQDNLAGAYELAERMRIKSDGNVGIGTTSPRAKLESYVSGNFSTTYNDFSGDGLYIQTNGTVADGEYTAGISFSRTASNNARVAGIAGVQEGSDADVTGLAFFTHPSGGTSLPLQESLRITSDGSVGIGTDSPATQLHLEGSAPYFRTKNTSAPTDEKTWDYNAGTDGTFRFRAVNDAATDANNWMVVDRSGVDINYITMSTGNQEEALRIDSSQRVGIGTTSPSEIIHTSTSSNNVGRFESTDGTAYIQINDTADSFYLATGSQIGSIGGNAGVNANNLNIDLTNGNVGIGTDSPQEQLHIFKQVHYAPLLLEIENDGYLSGASAGIKLSAKNTNGGAGYFQIENYQNNLRVLDDGTEKFRIEGTTGNVGIGTDSPDATLDAVGSINAAGQFTSTATSKSNGTYTLMVDSSAHTSNLSTAGAMSVDVNSGRAFTITGQGNVGIGTSSPGRVLHVEGTASVFGDTRSVLRLADNTAMATGVGGGLVFAGKATTGQGDSNTTFAAIHGLKENGTSTNTAGAMLFSTRTSGSNPEERMRIDSSGNLLVGKTSDDGTAGVRIGGSGTIVPIASGIPIIADRLSSDGEIIRFRKDGSTVGSVSVTSSATTYNTTSDARLKDVTGEARGLEVITKLNPVAYNWKADGKADEGLIAQEVKELVPNAVTGSEDEHYQMDYSKLVTHLVKGMKEQQEQIEFLKEEIANLKGE